VALKSAKRLAFGSGDILDYTTLFDYFVLGVGGGFILYVIFSLLGFGIYKSLKLFKL
jgi:hypothetical protein